MSIELTCRGCGKLLRVPDEHAGKQARCPACQCLSAIPVPRIESTGAEATGPANVGSANVGSANSQPSDAASGSSGSESEAESEAASSLTVQDDDLVLSEDAAAATPHSVPGSCPAQASTIAERSDGRGDTPVAGTASSAIGGVPQTAGRFSDPDIAEWSMKTPEGHTYGPVSKRTLDDWFREGRIGQGCQLRLGTSGAWQPAGQVYPQLKPTPQMPFRTPLGMPRQTSAGGQGPTGNRGFLTEHRGGQVLTLGILGVAVMCPILSVMAWVIGTGDLREMYAGRMDPAGVGSTQAGQILGIIASIIQLIILVCVLFFSLFAGF